uniref:C-type cytochrome n=1 Tax=Eiseniibacteriota bacterium TaxID=2212470 RepID=A0A832IAK9_UNCEI
MRRAPAAVLAVAAVALATVAALAVSALRPPPPAAERGRRLAERLGCFACHGPEGTRGAANPGRTDGSVPNFEGDLMMYASSPEDVRAWIRDGVTPKRAASATWRSERDRGALRMPAFGGRVSDAELDDLVAFVLASAGEPAPADPLAAHGLARAEALGCTGCHGAGGRLARPNPGSFKGYVPPWDGADFAELVRGRAEFDEWVRDGVSRRFAAHPAARFFLERAVLRMPAYGERLQPGDLDALWAYVAWLRSAPPAGAPGVSPAPPAPGARATPAPPAPPASPR